MNIQKMLQHSKELQWSVNDFDWQAEGKPDPEEMAHLKDFMSDLTWIEHVAHPAFSALEASVTDPDLKEIYRYFQKDEDRHARAEALLMKRWGMLKGSDMPTPSNSVKVLQQSTAKVVHQLHPSVLVAVIPMLELVLDGGLIKSLSSQVQDPLFHEVFKHINADEARHLVIDFHALEQYGLERRSPLDVWQDRLRSFTNLDIMRALFFGFMPYLAHANRSFKTAHIDWQLIRQAMRKYIHLGSENPGIAASPSYQIIKMYTSKLERGDMVIEDFMMHLSDLVAASPLADFVLSN